MSNFPRLPTVYIPHGGGPWPFMPPRPGAEAANAALRSYLASLPASLPGVPKAILMISAHWEASVPTVMTAPHPPMLYDYYGFPPATYEVQWPAPGAPALGRALVERLRAAGIDVEEDPKRGFDHGTFVPLSIPYPEPQIPTIQLSLKQGLAPAFHLAMGKALEPLRDEGVLIIGSGMSYHNMKGFFGRIPNAREDARLFHRWLKEAVEADPETRDTRLERWDDAPRARQNHPREEHLLPLMVVAGAAGQDRGRVTFDDENMGVSVLGAHFG